MEVNESADHPLQPDDPVRRAALRCARALTPEAAHPPPDLAQNIHDNFAAIIEATHDPIQLAGIRTSASQLLPPEYTTPSALRAAVPELWRELGQLLHPHKHLPAIYGAFASGLSAAVRTSTMAQAKQAHTATATARHHAEQARRSSDARFRAVFRDAAVGIMITTTDGAVVDVNRALKVMTGANPARIAAYIQRRSELGDSSNIRQLREELLAGQRDDFRYERQYTRSDGSRFWADVVVTAIRNDEGTPEYIVYMVKDITDRYELSVRLEHQARHDPLTELPNRTLFFERLTAVLSNADPTDRIGLCFLDLDNFKQVNDSLGHYVGDQLLIAAAQRLYAVLAIRPSHAARRPLLARTGGDEFVILAERTNGTSDIVSIANSALQALNAEPFRVSGHELPITASIGIVERAAHGSTASELLKDADTTLYWAKSAGRNQWMLFDSSRSAAQADRHVLAAHMPAALHNGEFFLEYQPLARLSDRKLVGMEALVRWRHPTRGVVSPELFVDVAESGGIIVDLGRWVLRKACEQARAWSDQFGARAPFMSVNIAVRQIQEVGLVDDVRQILHETGLPPSTLQLEIIERAVMGTADVTTRNLSGLAALGVQLAIDDFGTGYSNLAYLRRLPVNSVKLAGTFMAQAPTLIDTPDDCDYRLISTLIGMAHALNLSVTAEGIETPAQADQLTNIGCDMGQGWLFGKPLAPQQVTELLTRSAPE